MTTPTIHDLRSSGDLINTFMTHFVNRSQPYAVQQRLHLAPLADLEATPPGALAGCH